MGNRAAAERALYDRGTRDALTLSGTESAEALAKVRLESVKEFEMALAEGLLISTQPFAVSKIAEPDAIRAPPGGNGFCTYTHPG